MTTIAYRDGVLAADTLISFGSSTECQGVKAVQRGPYFAAISGDMIEGRRFLDWFSDGMKCPPPASKDKSDGFRVIFGPERILCFNDHGDGYAMTAPFWAIGSGANFAMGAMAAGADPKTAVEIATTYDGNTGGGVMVLTA